MSHNKLLPDELKQHFLSLTSIRERKALIESLSEKLKDLGKHNEPPDYIEVKNFMYEQLLAVQYERDMILQRRILTASDASSSTSSVAFPDPHFSE
ncbi:hypothetical protein AVEN_92847-1 [Araneus ventricosus]|uniref:Uncharacterized protein n=1 Tax=Araneus ventricosus TaxID=182803 RepID=A0A4Y2N5Z3_ARAVE|nr:hypothetical protein AVEN_92847-1 [Araneus ventricosus]